MIRILAYLALCSTLMCVIHSSEATTATTTTTEINSTTVVLDRSRRDINDLNNDYDFTQPDIIVEYKFTTNDCQTIVTLEGFKMKSNDQILREAKSDMYKRLHWLSLGHPTLVAMSQRGKPQQLFHWSSRGFYTMVNMLTPPLHANLKQKVKRKYNISLDDDQISNLILSSFKCKLELECGGKNKGKVLLNGQVTQLRTFPLRLDFDINTEYRGCIQQQHLFNSSTLIDEDYQSIECDAFQQSSIKKTKTMSISGKQLQQIGLMQSLFGDAEHKYVTRNQLNSLASQIFHEFKVYEELKVTEEVFSVSFVEDLIRQAADDDTPTFTNVPIKEALASLSPFSFNDKFSFQPDLVLYDTLIRALKVVREYGNNKSSRIVLNEENYNRVIMDRTRSEEIVGSGNSRIAAVDRSFIGIRSNAVLNENVNSMKKKSKRSTRRDK